MSKVAISRCAAYSSDEISASLSKLINDLGGIEQFVKPGQKILLKVNALMPASPDKHVSTHPELVRAVANMVIRAGATPVIGDSPGYTGVSEKRLFDECGFSRIAEELGIKTMILGKQGSVERSPVHFKELQGLVVAKLDGIDGIINLPKLKNHMMVVFTGAVKNMYGTVPGFHKSQFHFKYPDPDDFSRMLVEVYLATKPVLNIMDGVIGMEGNGPSAGRPKQIGLLLGSSDGVALDAVASKIVGYQPFDIPTTLFADKFGAGIGRTEQIRVTGEQLSSVLVKDFALSKSFYSLTKRVPKWMMKLVKPVASRIRINPFISPNICTACQTCANACPANCITVVNGKEYKIDHKKCIMCFCCHELCPCKAIELKSTLLARLLGFGKQ